MVGRPGYHRRITLQSGQVSLANSIHFGYNPSMMQIIKDLFQAAVIAMLIGGPLFYYMLFQMKP